jgi:hypothetical protein
MQTLVAKKPESGHKNIKTISKCRKLNLILQF